MLRRPNLYDLTHEDELTEQERINRAKQRAAAGGYRPSPTIEVTTSRPTVTRVIAGGLLAGPVGALAGLAWWKKSKQTIDGGGF